TPMLYSAAMYRFGGVTIVEENLHIRFSENTPNVVGSGPDWLFDIDALTRTMNYELIVTDLKSSQDDGFKPSSDDGKKVDEDPSKGNECYDQEKGRNVNSTNSINTVCSTVNAVGTNEDNELSFDPNMLNLEDVGTFYFSNKDEDDDAVADINNLDTTIQVSPTPTIRIHKDHPLNKVIRDLHSATQTRNVSKNLEEHGFVSTIQQRTNHKDLQNCLFVCFLSQEEPKKMDVESDFLYQKIEVEVYVCQPPGFEDPDFPDRVYKVDKALYGLHQAPRVCQDKYVVEILKKFGFTEVKNAITPMETQKHLLNDEDGEEVDVHMCRSMIGSLMYLTSSRPDIMFSVCACARYQVNPKVAHIYAVKRIFKYLKGQLKLGLWYPKDAPFDLVAYTDSDYAGASLDKKSTTGGCQFLGCRLISWQCKNQTVVANFTT
nr:ribonuclease H-like domain, reverse transcriptase, RNA-dependent DNA polymerase [Tanacetum cinerariifolium]